MPESDMASRGVCQSEVRVSECELALSFDGMTSPYQLDLRHGIVPSNAKSMDSDKASEPLTASRPFLGGGSDLCQRDKQIRLVNDVELKILLSLQQAVCCARPFQPDTLVQYREVFGT
jgi:hypothetical protein